jgi:uncharacterized protein YyaL (SSP411 family)
MVSPNEMRLFALECLRWSEEANNPGHRDLMMRLAKTWMETASDIEHRVSGAVESVEVGL